MKKLDRMPLVTFCLDLLVNVGYWIIVLNDCIQYGPYGMIRLKLLLLLLFEIDIVSSPVKHGTLCPNNASKNKGS